MCVCKYYLRSDFSSENKVYFHFGMHFNGNPTLMIDETTLATFYDEAEKPVVVVIVAFAVVARLLLRIFIARAFPKCNCYN